MPINFNKANAEFSKMVYLHRHLYEMCIIREIHTSLMCFGSVVTMCATYCNQFDSGIWTLCRHLSWTIPVSFHRVHIFW